MKSLSAKTFQCGVTVQGLTTLSGTVYLTALTNTATWDYVIVGTSAQGQLYTRTYAQLMSDVSSGITLSLDGLSDVVAPTPSTGQLLRYNGIQWANWTPTFYSLPAGGTTLQYIDGTGAFQTFPTSLPASSVKHQVKAGVAINKGQAVYVTSADGTNMIVGLASNASEATSSKTMGLLDATVTTNGFANVVTEGLLAGLDTSTAGAEGDPVWLGTGGNLIYGLANKPYAPAHLVFIGIVTRKNLNNGEIFIKVQNGFELREIHDVDLITTVPVNGHILGFDGTLWVNKTIAGWLGYTPANASGTTNYISKFTGTNTLGNSSFYDAGTPTVWVTGQNANSRFYFSPVHADGRINFNAVANTNDYTLLRAWHDSNQVGLGTGSSAGGGALTARGDSILIGTSGALYFMNGTFGPNNVPYRLGITTSATATYFTSGVNNNLTNIESNEFIYTAKAHTFRTGTTTGNQSQPNQYTPLFLSTAGNVGIGTTGLVPGYLLTINGGVSITAGQSLSLDPSAGIYMVASSSQFRLYNNSIAALSVASTGNVLINTTTDAGYKLDVNGTFRTNDRAYIGEDVTFTSPQYYYLLSASPDGLLTFTNNTVTQGQAQGFLSGELYLAGSAAFLNHRGINIITTNRNTSTGNIVRAFYASGRTGNTGAANTIAGFLGGVNIEGSGNVTNAIGLEVELLSQTNNKTITNMYGVKVQPLINSVGTITNTYGLYIDSLTAGTQTNPAYGIYQAGTDKNYFGGNVGIGTTSPSYKLQVNADGAGLYVLGANTAPYTQTIASFVYGGNGNSINIENQGGKASIQARAGGSAMDLHLNPVGGNVGIGVTSPSARLHVVGGRTYLETGNEIYTLGISRSGANAYYLGVSNALSPDLYFSNNAGTTRVTFTDGGNVGIGITSPGRKLDINTDGGLGNANNYLRLSASAAGAYSFNSYIEGYYNDYGNGEVARIGLIHFEGTRPGSNNVGGNIKFYTKTLGGLNTADPTVKMTITADGNVGIGTVSPTAKLHIDNSTQQFKISGNTNDFSIYNWAGGVNVWSSENLYFGRDAATANKFFFQNGGATATTLYINTATERVGIGTSSPMRALNIVSNNAQIRISDSTAPSTNYWEFSSVYFNTNQDLFISNQSITALTINSLGNVGIGTTSPSEALSISGSSTSGVGISLANGDGIGGRILADNSSLYFYSNNGTLVYSLNNSKIRLNDGGGGTIGIELGSNGSISQNGNGGGLTFSNTTAYLSNGLIVTAGNVGIGITTPGASLHIAKNGTYNNVSSTALRIANVTSPNKAIDFGYDNTADVGYIQGIEFGVAAKNLSLQSDGGKVGIGTTTPATKLDVSGVITATGGNSTNWNTAYGWGNHSLAGYVPQTRTLTINGTTYDLSANRSWTVSSDLQSAVNTSKVTTPVNPGANVVASFSVASYDGATFNYVLKDGTNFRAGTVVAVWNGATVQYNETTTNDIGNTTSVVLSVAISAGNAELIATSGTPGWTMKVVPIGI